MSEERSKGQETSAALALERLYEQVLGDSPQGKGYQTLCNRLQEEMEGMEEEIEELRRTLQRYTDLEDLKARVYEEERSLRKRKRV